MKTWIALSLAALTATAAETFDTVIANGRVMDPATELDAIRHIGITGGIIKSISKTFSSNSRPTPSPPLTLSTVPAIFLIDG